VNDEVQVERWLRDQPPEEAALRAICAQEGLHPYRWSNAPGDVYAAHAHSYDKVIYVVRGAITFGLPASVSRINLKPGDRLELPLGFTMTRK
jgi:quercetin dioxygenase-like cupin family protein